MILVDNSGSIGETQNGNREVTMASVWLSNVADVVQRHYIDNSSLHDVDMGLVEFGGQCETKNLSELGSQKSEISQNLRSIKPYPYLASNTPILLSISDAVNSLSKTIDPQIVLFTDLGENCTDIESECTLVKRIEDDLSRQRIKIDISVIGYNVPPEFKNNSIYSGLECFRSDSEWINLRYFDGGNNLSSLSSAAQAGFEFLEENASSSNRNTTQAIQPELSSEKLTAIFTRLTGFFTDFTSLIDSLAGLITSLGTLITALIGFFAWKKLKKKREEPDDE